MTNYNNHRLDRMISKDVGIPYHLTDTCYVFGILDGCPFYDHFIEGLGGPYYSGTCFEGVYQQQLVYYKKGSETWGTPLSINQYEGLSEQPKVNIYPNPWNYSTSIAINSTSDVSVSIFDNMGKQVSIIAYHSGNTTINLNRSDYKPGLYLFLVIPKAGNPVTRKFVVE